MTTVQPAGQSKRDLRGTWPQAILSLAGSILLILGIRWAFFEPYVIPSGSMIPSLLIHDHILVNKFSYGVRLPFSNLWLVRYSTPKRGDVIVFKSHSDDSVFLVKRVVGLPGEQIEIDPQGNLLVDGRRLSRKPLSKERALEILKGWPAEEREAFADRYEIAEQSDDSSRSHLVAQTREEKRAAQGPFKVPPNSLFMVGDNRDNSSDSRVSGAISMDRILGRASLIWLSCEETLPDASQVCDPNSMRWERIFKGIR